MKKKIIAILTMLTLLLFMNTLTFAEDFNVSYEGDAGKFIFLNGSEGNIFDNFKDIAPGESRSQTITLTNNDSERMRFFMQTTAMDELGDADAVFIITITRDGTELYSGTIQGLKELGSGSMEDSLMLADLSKGETAEVLMMLEVDETLPSGENYSYENAETAIQFTFAVDSPPPNEGRTKTVYEKQDRTVYKQGPSTVRRVVSNIATRVKTEDPTTLGLYIGILAAGAAAIAGLVVYKRRKRNEEV